MRMGPKADTALGLKLPKEAIDRLEEYCRQHEITKTLVIYELLMKLPLDNEKIPAKKQLKAKSLKKVK
jgi:hypothetical protein